MTNEVSRTEFDGSIQSIRREIQTMGENLNRQLAAISLQLSEMSRSTSEDSRELATLKVRVESLEEWKRNNQTLTRLLWVGLLGSIAAQVFQLVIGRR